MRIVKVGVLAPTNKGVPLGVQGESCATEVEFDVRPWLREYPSGTVSAVARREGDPAPYPLTLDVAYGMAVWVVSDTDTAKAGEGAVELTLTSAGTRVRSLTFKTLVTASLTDAPVDDDAWYGWLDKAVVKVDETVQAAQRKLSEVDQEWTGLKADVNAKVDECSKAAAQAAEDAHRAKVDAKATAMRSSSSITVADGTAKVNPAIFGDGLSVTDGQVSVDLDHVGEHLAGDALYYDQTDGLMLKVGQGLHIQNDELDIDQANLPLASEGVRGTVRVGSGLAIDADGVLSATGGGGAGSGYGKLAKATLKTTERVSGIADGEDDVVTDAAVPCAVGEMDGELFLTSASAYRVLRTTYTTGTVLHLEFEWSVDGAQLDPSMLTHAVLSLGNASTLVPMTTRSVDGKRYKAVEYTATSDIKAGMSVSLKFI